MEIRQVIRVFTFAYINLLPSILSFWMVTILPEILEHNLHIKDKEELSRVGGFFFTSFYMGMMAGSLVWPNLLDYMSKRSAVIMGLIFQGVFNALTGYSSVISVILLYRFMTGVFQNLHTVGKDFVFEFAKPAYRQYAFTYKTFFSFFGSLIGPFIGWYCYTISDRSFSKCLIYISMLYASGIVLFFLVFYLDYTPGDNADQAADDEEEKNILQSADVDFGRKDRQKGVWDITKLCAEHPVLRNMILVYSITSGVNKTLNYMTVFFLEASWKDQGLGLSSKVVTYISLFSFIPASLIVLLSPAVVPKYVSYGAYIRFFILSVIIALTSLPVMRDVLPNNGPSYIWVVYIFQGFLNITVPKIYSPFINFYLNRRVDKYSRTALNSLTFILGNLSASIIITIAGPVFAYAMYNDAFEGYRQLSKYIPFIFLDLMLALAYFFMHGQANK